MDDVVKDPQVRAILNAWLVPGPVPDYHRAMQERLRREWPVLAAAVEGLAERATGSLSTHR